MGSGDGPPGGSWEGAGVFWPWLVSAPLGGRGKKPASPPGLGELPGTEIKGSQNGLGQCKVWSAMVRAGSVGAEASLTSTTLGLQ